MAQEGTTAYLKLAYHAPGVNDADFFPMLVLDAILTGAKGINLWSSFRTAPPQRSARLYRALVETRPGVGRERGLLPTEHPFLYLVSATAMDGVAWRTSKALRRRRIDQVAKDGVTDQELAKAKNQLRARLVFENDSVTNLGHQLGFFETVAKRGCVSQCAAIDRRRSRRSRWTAWPQKYLRTDQRTVGWFSPTAGAAS